MADTNISLRTLNELIGQKITEQFPVDFWVMAEIMEISVNRSGHCYLELIEKSEDDDRIVARSRATIWSYRYRMIKPYFETTTGSTLRRGIKVLLKVTVSFHEIYGLSLNVSDIDPSFTVGDLAVKRREIIAKLRRTGVFDMNRELPFPAVPQKIAVISSETAAGYGDFMDTLLNNRYGFRYDVDLFPAVMQGDAAEASIIGALEEIHTCDVAYDLVVLIRGGGSRADLQCFDGYELCLNLAQFPLPVVTGIGHERDETIADMVSHQALKTPTAVAEHLIDRLLEFSSYLQELEEQLYRVSRTGLQNAARQLALLSEKMKYLWRNYLVSTANRLDDLTSRLGKYTVARLDVEKERLGHLEKNLELLKPERVLARGYSISFSEGKVIKSTAQVNKGDELVTRMADGSITSIVSGNTSTNKK